MYYLILKNNTNMIYCLIVSMLFKEHTFSLKYTLLRVVIIFIRECKVELSLWPWPCRYLFQNYLSECKDEQSLWPWPCRC